MILNYILCNPVTTFSKLLTVILNCVQQEKIKKEIPHLLFLFSLQKKVTKNHKIMTVGIELLRSSPTINPTLPDPPVVLRDTEPCP